MSIDISSRLALDVIENKCHVLIKKYGNMQSVYSSDKAFDALNYIISVFSNTEAIYISDVASLWIEIESHEQYVKGLKQNSKLFETFLDKDQERDMISLRYEPEFI